MARLWVQPEYRDRLTALGLRAATDFLDLPGVIVSGHPDRHVMRVQLAPGWTVYVKRQMRIPIKQRIKNALASFGFASTAVREYQALLQVREAGIGCPRPIAAGEDGAGRAFLMLEAIESVTPLRQALALGDSQQRRRLARQLGHAVARMHVAGWEHRELFAKHVLVRESGEMIFLDWQRARRARSTSLDLAALDATLPDEFGTTRERLAVLRSYLLSLKSRDREGAGRRHPLPHGRGSLKRMIRLQAQALLHKSRVQEARDSSPTEASVHWLDGERLCVTGDCLERIDRLRRSSLSLERNTYYRPFAWLRRFTSPEIRKAGQLFRARRLGQPAPTVLAFGQESDRPWRVSAFLLTEDTEATP